MCCLSILYCSYIIQIIEIVESVVICTHKTQNISVFKESMNCTFSGCILHHCLKPLQCHPKYWTSYDDTLEKIYCQKCNEGQKTNKRLVEVWVKLMHLCLTFGLVQ